MAKKFCFENGWQDETDCAKDCRHKYNFEKKYKIE